jgi:hypothetical protein
MHTYYDIWNWQPDKFSEVTISFQKKVKLEWKNDLERNALAISLVEVQLKNQSNMI